MNSTLLVFIGLSAIVCIQQGFILFLLLKSHTPVKQQLDQYEIPFECFIEQDTGKHISYY